MKMSSALQKSHRELENSEALVAFLYDFIVLAVLTATASAV